MAKPIITGYLFPPPGSTYRLVPGRLIMIEAIVRIIVGLAAFVLLMSFLATAAVKFFARPLSFGQAFIISVFSFTISTLLIAVYFYIKASMGLPSAADGVATIVSLLLTGVLITRRARAYGIKKTGWLGVGAKTILALIAFSWVLAGLYMAITAMINH
jgi:hypothetical protein